MTGARPEARASSALPKLSATIKPTGSRLSASISSATAGVWGWKSKTRTTRQSALNSRCWRSTASCWKNHTLPAEHDGDGGNNLPGGTALGRRGGCRRLAIPLYFKGNPEFCEMTVEQEIGLMVELHGKWFYKAPHVKTIDH